MSCDHEDFHAVVNVARLTASEDGPVTGFSCSIRVYCTGCGEAMEWLGPPTGLLASQPAVSLDRTELHAPCRPVSSPEGFGLDMPGFSVSERIAPGYGREAN